MKTASINTKSYHSFEKAKYNPALDHLIGKVIFKEKLKSAEKTLSETVFPQEVIDLMTRKISK
jgi:hypothetical protein